MKASSLVRGPGLQWGVMGPNLLLHLAAGPGGIHEFMAHRAGPISSCWSDLGTPELTPKIKQALIDGALSEAGDRSFEQLARERDEALLALIRLRRRLAKPPGPARSARARRRT